MAVGFSRTKEDLDQRIGAIVLQLRSIMTDIDRMAELAAAVGPAGLAEMGYDQQDIALLSTVLNDMTGLVAIARGERTQAEAHDFTQAARLVMGVL
jgi:hypothetical protein